MQTHCPCCNYVFGEAEPIQFDPQKHTPNGIVLIDAFIGRDGALQTPGPEISHCDQCAVNRRRKSARTVNDTTTQKEKYEP